MQENLAPCKARLLEANVRNCDFKQPNEGFGSRRQGRCARTITAEPEDSQSRVRVHTEVELATVSLG
eukprot:3490112-Amphidinium_carterae.1